jgi:hypothetical protein
MTQYVEGEISGKQFTQEYLTAFKQEGSGWAKDREAYNVLDAVFGMADSYFDDPEALAEVRAESPDPAFWLGDEDLKQGILKALKKLRSLH